MSVNYYKLTFRKSIWNLFNNAEPGFNISDWLRHWKMIESFDHIFWWTKFCFVRYKTCKISKLLQTHLRKSKWKLVNNAKPGFKISNWLRHWKMLDSFDYIFWWTKFYIVLLKTCKISSFSSKYKFLWIQHNTIVSTLSEMVESVPKCFSYANIL